jgi:hypothetical protein
MTQVRWQQQAPGMLRAHHFFRIGLHVAEAAAQLQPESNACTRRCAGVCSMY